MQACYEKGPARMAEIGHSQLERIIAGLANITPDFADMSWSSPSGISMPGPDRNRASSPCRGADGAGRTAAAEDAYLDQMFA